MGSENLPPALATDDDSTTLHQAVCLKLRIPAAVVEEEGEGEEAVVDNESVVSILPLVIDPKKRQHLPTLCPTFRLLFTCFKHMGMLEQVKHMACQKYTRDKQRSMQVSHECDKFAHIRCFCMFAIVLQAILCCCTRLSARRPSMKC